MNPVKTSYLGDFRKDVYPNGTESYYRDAGHSYWKGVKEKPDGTFGGVGRIYSPSSIAKSLDPGGDGLGIWFGREDAKGLREHLIDLADAEGPSELLSELLRLEDRALDDVLASRGWRASRQKSADEGIVAHTALEELLVDGKISVDVPDECEPLVEAIQSFFAEYSPSPIAVECPVYSEIHNYAGRFDALVDIEGSVVLLDLKTNRSTPGSSAMVQLAGYELAARECGVGDPSYAAILHVSRDGTFDVILSEATPDDFLTALEAFNAGRRIGKAARAATRNRTKGRIDARLV